MMTVETSFEGRLTTLAAMLRDLSRDPDPVQSVNRYATAMRQLYGDQGMISVSRRGAGEGCFKVMRLIHQEGVDFEGIQSVSHAGKNAPSRCGGVISDILADERPVVIRDLDVPDDPVLGIQLSPYRLLVAFPVFDMGEPLNWMIFLSTDPFGFSDADVEDRFVQSNLMGGIANTKRTTLELREMHTRVQREIDEIATIQRSLLPTSLPKIPGLEVSAIYNTYDRAGGDYYDIFAIGAGSTYASPLNHPRWGILIADVAGHGPSAAVVMAMLSSLLHSYHADHERPGQVLEYLSRHLSVKSVNHTFATVFLGVIDTQTRLFTYASAGHPMPLLRDVDGSVTDLAPTGGIPVGVAASDAYAENELQLQPGQQLLLYTDGITESRSLAGSMFSADGLRSSFQKASGTAKEILKAIQAGVMEHIGASKADDDQTMVLLRLK